MVLPGKTIGILGGGQLGRMFAIAARRMGYRVHSFDPTIYSPTGQIADLEINAPYDDVDAAKRFADGVDVVTFEFENVPSQTLETIEKLKPVFPSPFVLDTTRHRLKEKTFLSNNGFPVAPFRSIENIDQLKQAIVELGTPCILKTAEFGYDGKGQSRINSIDDAEPAWKKLNCSLGVLEGFVQFDREISVIVARSASGESRTFDVFENVHVNHILDVTTCGGPRGGLPWPLQEKAIVLARQIAQKIELVGLLCVEMFVRGSEVIVNELAPRPHNSGHVTFDACVTSQFEQQLRAVCGLPLGDTTLLKPTAMVNLLGDIWFTPIGEPKWDRALNDPRAKLHLYGKSEPQKGRKMGHITAMADSIEQARQIAIDARRRLTE